MGETEGNQESTQAIRNVAHICAMFNPSDGHGPSILIRPPNSASLFPCPYYCPSEDGFCCA